MKARPFRSFWRDFENIYLPACFCLFLLIEAFCLPSLSSLDLALCGGAFFFALSSSSNPPLSCLGVILALLDFLPNHSLVIWRDGSVLFHFGKEGCIIFSIFSLSSVKATLFYLAGSVVCLIYLLKSPMLYELTFCLLSTGRSSTIKSAVSLFLSISRSILYTVSFFHAVWHIRKKLSILSKTAFYFHSNFQKLKTTFLGLEPAISNTLSF